MPSYPDTQERAGLTVTVRLLGGSGRTALAELAGELDIASAPFALARLRAVLCEPGLAELAVDVFGISFIDAAGLAPLLATVRLAERRGQRCTLRRPSRAVSRVLSILDLQGLAAGE